MGVIDQGNPVQRAREKAKNEFYLPAVRIEQHPLECREIGSVGQQQELGRTDPEGDQAIHMSIGIVGTGNELASDVPKHKQLTGRDVPCEDGVNLILVVMGESEKSIDNS